MTCLPKSAVRFSFLLIALFAMPLSVARGQEYAPSLEPAQIDQMMAPIALYPDSLITQILMAATYPLQVVEAHRWLQEPQNKNLRSDQIESVMDQLPWDPSVKSLLVFPQVLSMMNDNLQWTEQLGNAFLAQRTDVMDSVQHLRQLAQDSGNLVSTPQQIVSRDADVIVIEPANPQVVYVPYYVPTAVYGAWPYPAYPPNYFQWAGYPPNRVGVIEFRTRVVVINWLWGWGRWNWHQHRIDIDDHRYARINHGRPPVIAGEWRHEPERRRDLPYIAPAAGAPYHIESESARPKHRETPAVRPSVRQEEPVRRVEPRVLEQPSPVIQREERKHEVRPAGLMRNPDMRERTIQTQPDVQKQPDVQRQPRHEARPAGLIQHQPEQKRLPPQEDHRQNRRENPDRDEQGVDSREHP